MHSHTLTTTDEWFIKKGQKDSLSKTPFGVGHTVVVCDHQHVMLAEFYDGECPTCHSHNTVPFSRQNVEPGTLRSYRGKCPECSKEVGILFIQHGSNSPFVGRCPECNNNISVNSRFFFRQALVLKLRECIGRVNVVLGCVLGLLIVVTITLLAIGVISNDNIVSLVKYVVLPKSKLLYERFPSFIDSDVFFKSVVAANNQILEKSTDFLSRIAPMLFSLSSEVLNYFE